MNHALVKTIIINKVIELIAKKYKVNLSDAMDMFYQSEIINKLNDKETGLYGESPLFVFSLFEIYHDNK